jgi:hypothetical protein
VICCLGNAEEALTAMRRVMSKLKLTVNEKKTRLCRLPDETIDVSALLAHACCACDERRIPAWALPGPLGIAGERLRARYYVTTGMVDCYPFGFRLKIHGYHTG